MAESEAESDGMDGKELDIIEGLNSVLGGWSWNCETLVPGETAGGRVEDGLGDVVRSCECGCDCGRRWSVVCSSP